MADERELQELHLESQTFDTVDVSGMPMPALERITLQPVPAAVVRSKICAYESGTDGMHSRDIVSRPSVRAEERRADSRSRITTGLAEEAEGFSEHIRYRREEFDARLASDEAERQREIEYERTRGYEKDEPRRRRADLPDRSRPQQREDASWNSPVSDRYEPLQDFVPYAQRRDPAPWTFDRKMFPIYKTGQDILAFFALFEQTCRDLNVAQRYFMTILRSQVADELADLLGSIPIQDGADYQKFKALALQRFALSSESYRRQFRRTDKSLYQGNFHMAAATIAQNLDRWLSSEGVSTFCDLRELMLLEQFFRILPEELSALVKDWEPVSLQQAADLAQRMRQHREKALGRTVFTGASARPAGERAPKAESPASTPAKKPSVSPTAASVRPRVTVQSGLCFYCKQPNHKRNDCPALKAKENKQKTSTPASSSKPQVRVIQPHEQENWEEESTAAVPTQTSSASAPVESSVNASQAPAQVTGTLQPASVAFINPNQVRWSQMEFSHQLRVNHITVIGYRDTGTDISSVDCSLVKPEQPEDQPLEDLIRELLQPRSTPASIAALPESLKVPTSLEESVLTPSLQTERKRPRTPCVGCFGPLDNAKVAARAKREERRAAPLRRRGKPPGTRPVCRGCFSGLMLTGRPAEGAIAEGTVPKSISESEENSSGGD